MGRLSAGRTHGPWPFSTMTKSQPSGVYSLVGVESENLSKQIGRLLKSFTFQRYRYGIYRGDQSGSWPSRVSGDVTTQTPGVQDDESDE